MFNFFKKKEKQTVAKCELTVEQSAAFFKADSEARKAAGLENLPGEYTFTCPKCGSKCKGSWHARLILYPNRAFLRHQQI